MVAAEMGNFSCRRCADVCSKCMSHSGMPEAEQLCLHLNVADELLRRHGVASCLGLRHVLHNAAMLLMSQLS